MKLNAFNFQVFNKSLQTPRFRDDTYTSLQLLLNKYCALFSEKPPKGFGKFFGERSSKPPKSNDTEQSSSSSSSSSGKSEQSPGTDRQSDSKRADKSDKMKFEFKSSFGSSNQGSDGKKSGGKENSEREKWFTFGMIGSAIAIAAISYYGYSYQEISWKDLTT